MIAKNANFQKIGEGVVLPAQKSTRPSFRLNKNIFSNIEFIVFEKTGFATRFQRSNLYINPELWGWDIPWDVWYIAFKPSILVIRGGYLRWNSVAMPILLNAINRMNIFFRPKGVCCFWACRTTPSPIFWIFFFFFNHLEKF
jgi:hypothetical protein